MNVTVNNCFKTFKRESFFSEDKNIVKALDGVNVFFEESKITAIVGESGSGKTTLARCIAGLEKADLGEILIGGRIPDYSDRGIRRAVQYVFQDTYNALNPRMTIGAAIEEPLEVHFGLKGGALKERAAAVLASAGLSESFYTKHPHELSGGQRQRAGIARALTLEPKLLIADEPVSSLDVSVQAQILNLLLDLNRRGLTVIFITHDLRVVRSLADRVIVMQNGRVAEEGETEKVFKNPADAYTKKLLESLPGAAFKF